MLSKVVVALPLLSVDSARRAKDCLRSPLLSAVYIDEIRPFHPAADLVVAPSEEVARFGRPVRTIAIFNFEKFSNKEL